MQPEEDLPGPPPGFPPGLGGQQQTTPPAQEEKMAATRAVAEREAAEEESLPDYPADDDADTGGGGRIEVKPAQGSIYKAAKSFKDLDLSQPLLTGLYNEMHFDRPSQIQAKALPLVLHPPYRSLVAQAHNGSGKTTCFVLAMLSRVDPSIAKPQALCLCPTRELVVQNRMVTEKMGKHTGVQVQTTANDELFLPKGAKLQEQVIIATHGRLKTWVTRRFLDFGGIRILVFDEADQMLDRDGFLNDSMRMVQTMRQQSPGLQILLFSATFSPMVKQMAATMLGPDAHQVFVPTEELSLDVISQYLVKVPEPAAKVKVVKDHILTHAEKVGQTIIFVRTRDRVEQLHRALAEAGHKCTTLKGDMDRVLRDQVVDEFRTGATKILIATDVLARGFDVSSVTLVINFDPPTQGNSAQPAPETYLHRIGRSGRFGRKGAAFNLVCGPAEERIIDAIQEHFKRRMPEVPWDDEDAFVGCLKDAGLTEGDLEF